MTYRDDHEAALARVSALEQALTKERAEDEAREERIDVLEQELRDERAKLARAEAELKKLRPEPPPERVPVPTRSTPDAPMDTSQKLLAAFIISVVAIVGLVILIGLGTSKSNRESYKPLEVRPPQVALPDDISMYLDEARARRDEILPGARLIELRARGVDMQGQLHSVYGKIEFELHRVNEPPPRQPEVDRPIGAPKPPEPAWDRTSCATLERDASRWTDSYDGVDDSRFGLLGFCDFMDRKDTWDELDLACTTRAIWAMALADGAPPGAIANIETNGGSWDFTIDDERAPFEKTYPDDCVPAEGEP